MAYTRGFLQLQTILVVDIRGHGLTPCMTVFLNWNSLPMQLVIEFIIFKKNIDGNDISKKDSQVFKISN